MLAEGPVLPAEAPSQPAAGPCETAEAKLASQGLKQEDGGLPSTEPVVAARLEPAPALKGYPPDSMEPSSWLHQFTPPSALFRPLLFLGHKS